jgi:selenocysteine lyase/cysteine desulfurase
MCAIAHEHGAITVVDAVHYSAHFPTDVKEIGTDVLLCSAYKFFGPHMGVIYIKEELVDRLQFYNVGADGITQGISKFQFGTPPFETICGVGEAVRYIERIGNNYAAHFEKELEGLSGARRGIVSGFMAIDHHEEPLARFMREEFRRLPGVTVYGPAEGEPRSPTVVITVDGKHPADICRTLNDNGIYAWDGDFYATVVVNEVLGLKDKGGLVRFGLAPYNTKEDVERAVSVIAGIV